MSAPLYIPSSSVTATMPPESTFDITSGSYTVPAGKYASVKPEYALYSRNLGTVGNADFTLNLLPTDVPNIGGVAVEFGVSLQVTFSWSSTTNGLSRSYTINLPRTVSSKTTNLRAIAGLDRRATASLLDTRRIENILPSAVASPPIGTTTIITEDRYYTLDRIILNVTTTTNDTGVKSATAAAATFPDYMPSDIWVNEGTVISFPSFCFGRFIVTLYDKA